MFALPMPPLSYTHQRKVKCGQLIIIEHVWKPLNTNVPLSSFPVRLWNTLAGEKAVSCPISVQVMLRFPCRTASTFWACPSSVTVIGRPSNVASLTSSCGWHSLKYMFPYEGECSPQSLHIKLMNLTWRLSQRNTRFLIALYICPQAKETPLHCTLLQGPAVTGSNTCTLLPPSEESWHSDLAWYFKSCARFCIARSYTFKKKFPPVHYCWFTSQ